MDYHEQPARELSVYSRVTGLPEDKHRVIILPGDFAMHVRVINEGAPTSVLFLHGVGSAPELLLHTLDYLAAKYNVTIHVLYLPCHGRSDSVHSFEQLINVIALTADELGLSHVACIGHSLGAHLLMCLAKSRPDIVASGVAMAMPIKIHTSGIQFLTTIPALGVDAFVTSHVAIVESLFDGNILKLSMALMEAGNRVVHGRPIFEVLKGADDLRKVMPHVKQPFTLLYGALDLPVRPVNFEIGDNFTKRILAGMPHNFPWLWPAIHDISDALAEALQVAQSLPIAEVIPLHPPVLPQRLQLPS